MIVATVKPEDKAALETWLNAKLLATDEGGKRAVVSHQALAELHNIGVNGLAASGTGKISGTLLDSVAGAKLAADTSAVVTLGLDDYSEKEGGGSHAVQKANVEQAFADVSYGFFATAGGARYSFSHDGKSTRKPTDFIPHWLMGVESKCAQWVAEEVGKELAK